MYIRKILAFTGIRSDYDLLSSLYMRIHDDEEMELALIVSGAHLSNTFGNTVQYIEKDGFPILARIESLIDSDSRSSRIKSISILLNGCLNVVSAYNPHVILYVGDREEVMVGALIGAYLGIPTVHFFGGDHASDGHVDNPVRHAVSKLSSSHFVVEESHRERLLKIGEPDFRIHLVGNPAIEKYKKERLINKAKLLQDLNCPDWQEYSIVIFHPLLGFENNSGDYIEQILILLKKKNVKSFVNIPNSDAGNRGILDVLEKYKQEECFHFFKNLSRIMFVNLMRHAMFLIGNSSAGLYEAPFIPLPAVNVGQRQLGRSISPNVIYVDQNNKEILKGIEKAMSKKFRNTLRLKITPKIQEDPIGKSYKILKNFDFESLKFKKEDPLNL